MRQRAADDVETIYDAIQRLKREREETIRGEEPVQPPCDVEQKPLEDYACGYREWFEKSWCIGLQIPGEFTDGA
jgi:hypothetical protein